MWNLGWEELHQKKSWGKYPCEELIRFMISTYKNKKNIKVLELGCGSGANLFFLSKEGFKTYGIDGSKTAIFNAKKFLKRENCFAHLTIGDIINLPYQNAFFDCVIDVECLYSNSLSDTKKINTEVIRVLKKGGYFFSKTFSTSFSPKKIQKKDIIEKNTYKKIPDCVFNSNYGLIRLTSEKDILKIYGLYKNVKYDYIIRSLNNRNITIKEWIIKGKK